MTASLPGPSIDTGRNPIPRRTILPRWLKAMVACATVLAASACLLAAVLFTQVHDQTISVQRAAMVNTRTLCAFRTDLQRRVDSGTQFLSEHPRGALGFTRQELQTTINNQQRTISSLGALTCPKP